MLKSCWDCIGYSREQATNEITHGFELNGRSARAPPWPKPMAEKNIFILPKELYYINKVVAKGNVTNGRRQFAVSLITGDSSPNPNNIAFQLKATFPHNGSQEDKISIIMIENGQVVLNEDQDNFTASGYFDGSFEIEFEVNAGNVINVYIDGNNISEHQLKHNPFEIRFLSVEGDATLTDLNFGLRNE